jgi:uncharacterized membrane protein YgaE (UPF0421/DUF939 family)
MTSFTTFLLKSTFYSTVVIGIGYGLMVNIVPTEEELLKSIKENKYRKWDEKEMLENKENNKRMIQNIIENSKKNRPIWKVGDD